MDHSTESNSQKPEAAGDDRADAERYRKLRALARTEGRDGGWSGYWVLPMLFAWNDSPDKRWHMKRRSFDQAVDAITQPSAPSPGPLGACPSTGF